MAGGPTRQDTYTVNVQLEDVATGNMLNLGTFDKFAGGAVDSDDNKYYPGGMVPPISLGGRRTVDNVTVSRLYRLARDHDHVQRHINGVGRAQMVVTKQPMDIEGHVYGRPIVYRGTLKRFLAPEVDSEASAAGLFELEMSVEGFPSS